MKRWCTEFKAICALTGELKTYAGESNMVFTKSLMPLDSNGVFKKNEAGIIGENKQF